MLSSSHGQVGAHAVFSCLVELRGGEIRKVECMVWAKPSVSHGANRIELHLLVDGHDSHEVIESLTARVRYHVLLLDHPESSIKNHDCGQWTGNYHIGSVSPRRRSKHRLAVLEVVAFAMEAVGDDVACLHFDPTPPPPHLDQTRPCGFIDPAQRRVCDPEGLLERARKMFRPQSSPGGAHT